MNTLAEAADGGLVEDADDQGKSRVRALARKRRDGSVPGSARRLPEDERARAEAARLLAGGGEERRQVASVRLPADVIGHRRLGTDDRQRRPGVELTALAPPHHPVVARGARVEAPVDPGA